MKKTDKHFNFQGITSADVERCLKGIKRLKSNGLDGLPPCLLKDSVSVISLPLAHIINLTFSTGVFSKSMEKCKNRTCTQIGINVKPWQLQTNLNTAISVQNN